jgi:transitional endoplasmic reticulum ATPase
VPDEGGRRRILAIHVGDMPLADDVNLDLLAARTERFTGADLEDLVRRAGMIALRQSLDATAVRMAHFDEALEETRASVTPEMEREYEQISQRLKQDALALQPIGFVTPGTMERGEVKAR